MVAERLSTGTAVAATVLGNKPFFFQTSVDNAQLSTVIVFSPQQIVVHAPVKLLTEDRLLLGHVRECQPEGEWWRTTIRVEHSLANLPELLDLAARFK